MDPSLRWDDEEAEKAARLSTTIPPLRHSSAGWNPQGIRWKQQAPLFPEPTQTIIQPIVDHAARSLGKRHISLYITLPDHPSTGVPSMKTLSLILLAALFLTTPAIACPDHDHGSEKSEDKGE